MLKLQDGYIIDIMHHNVYGDVFKSYKKKVKFNKLRTADKPSQMKLKNPKASIQLI